MPFFAASEAPPRPESMKFPVFSLLAGNLAFSETSSQLTPPSSEESGANFISISSITQLRFAVSGRPLYGSHAAGGGGASSSVRSPRSVRRTQAKDMTSARPDRTDMQCHCGWLGGARGEPDRVYL